MCVCVRVRVRVFLCGFLFSHVTLSWPLGLFLSTSPVTFPSLSIIVNALGPGLHCIRPEPWGQAPLPCSCPAHLTGFLR